MSEPTIPDIQLIDNSSQRTPCVLVLDGSGSMHGDPIAELNEGLKALEAELKADDTASVRVQLLVIRAGDYDEASVIADWTDAIEFTAPAVEANGRTPLGKAMGLALDMVEQQKANYDSNGIPYTRPWIMLISDGVPTDRDWEGAAARCRDAEANKKVAIFPIGTVGADLEALNQFSERGAMRLDGLRFRELFLWLSRSVSSASKSAPGQTTQLAATDGWAAVQN